MKDALIIAAKPADDGMTFKLPEGVDVGDAKPGDTIERVVAFKIGDGGMATLESIEGIPLDGSDSTDMTDRSTAQPSDDDGDETNGGGLSDIAGNIRKSIGVPAGS